VFGEQVQHDRDLRVRATARDLTGLVAGQFHRPVLRHRLRVQHFQQRQADVADQPGALARGTQQVRQQRGGGALALGAGHAHGVVHDAIGGSLLGEPQRGTADELRALRGGLQRRLAIRADARRFDHHLERRERRAGDIRTDRQRPLGFLTGRGSFGLRAEQGQRQRR